MLLHHMIDIEYIDININLAGNDSVRNIMTPTNQLSAASGKGRLSALWVVSALVALAPPASRAAKPTGSSSMLYLFYTLGPSPSLPLFTCPLLAVRPPPH